MSLENPDGLESLENLTEERLAQLRECTSAKDVLAMLAEDGLVLNDEQLEAVAGGAAASWSLEELLDSFGDMLASIFPVGFDPKTVWGNLPTGSMH